jgi:hypothetical protein
MSLAKDLARMLRAVFELCHGDPEQVLDIKEAGRAAGLTDEQARVLAMHLRDRGWIHFERGFYDGGSLSITTAGNEEVNRLMRPAWRKLLDSQLFRTAVAAAVASAVTLILTWLLGR